MVWTNQKESLEIRTSSAIINELRGTRPNLNSSESLRHCIREKTGCSLFCAKRGMLHISGPKDGVHAAAALVKMRERMYTKEESLDVSLSTNLHVFEVCRGFEKEFGVKLHVRDRVMFGERILRVAVAGIEGPVKEAVEELHRLECLARGEPFGKPPGLELQEQNLADAVQCLSIGEPPGLERQQSPLCSASSTISTADSEGSSGGY